MNDINFNSPRSPDPINSAPRSELELPVKPVYKKENSLDPALRFSLVILSIFLIILSFSTVYSLISKTIGQGEIVTNEQGGTISVNASMTVYATPDVAKVNIGVETFGVSMEEAVAENLRKATNIINYAQGEGVLSEDIKVIEYLVEPQYQKQTKGVDLKQYPEGKIVISSYKIKENIEIKMPTDKIQAVIQSALDSGASTVSNLSFDIKDKESYIADARTQAINKAKEEAQKIAQELNVGLGNPLNYSDSNYGAVYDYKYAESARGFEVGQNEITVSVYITYSIK